MKDKYIPFTDVQKELMTTPDDDSFIRCRKDFFLKVGRDMVCSEHQELHKRLLSLEPQNWDELNAVKAIFNNGKWLDKNATKAMIGLLTTLRVSPDSVSEKTRNNLDSDSRSSLFCITLAVFFCIPIIFCLNRDTMIIFGAGYFAAFPIAIALHCGVAAWIGLLIYNSFFDKKILERNGYNEAAYNDKLLLQSQFGFTFEENVCKNILYPFFDIDNYIKQEDCKENVVCNDKNIKQLENKSFRKKIKNYILWGAISIVVVTFLLLVGMAGAKKPLLQ